MSLYQACDGNASMRKSMPSSSVHRHYRWELLALLCLAFFLHQADRAIFGVVLPAIQTDLGLTNSQVGLIGTVLFLALAVMMPRCRLRGRCVQPEVGGHLQPPVLEHGDSVHGPDQRTGGADSFPQRGDRMGRVVLRPGRLSLDRIVFTRAHARSPYRSTRRRSTWP